MAQGTNMNTAVEPPQRLNPLQIHVAKLREAVRSRVCKYLEQKALQKVPTIDTALRDKCITFAARLEEILYQMAKTEEEYCDLRTLQDRVNALFKNIQRRSHEQRLAKITSVTPTPLMVPTFTSTNTNLAAPTFQSGSLPPISGGASFHSTVPVGFNTTTYAQSLYTDGSNVPATAAEPQRQQNSSGNYHVVGGYGPNIHQVTSGMCIPQPTGFGIGFGMNSVPLASVPVTSYEPLSSTHVPNLSTPLVQMNNSADSLGSNNPYGVVTSSGSMAVARDTISSNLNRVDATFTSNQLNQQGMQHNLSLQRHLLHLQRQSASTSNRNLANVSQQHLNHGNLAQVSQQHPNNGFYQQVCDIDHQGQHSQQMSQQHVNRGLYQQASDIDEQRQHSQQIYSGQLQKQDQLLNVDAYQAQLATRLATPVKLEPILGSCNEALQQQALNGFKPSKLQQNAVKDHCVGAQSASIRSNQPNFSSSSRAHAQQKQAASVVVQRKSSLQKSTQISENNNGEREHVGVNLCQRTTTQPKAVNHSLSAKAPIYRQIDSPRSTAGSKCLPNGNNKSSKQVNEVEIRWLSFLVHARHCKKTVCVTTYCSNAKELLKHMQHCNALDCTYRYCLQSRKWVDHFKKCKNKLCHVCVSVRGRMSHSLGAKCQPREFLESMQANNKRGAEAPSLECQPRESSDSMQANNKRGAEAPSVDDDRQPSSKRPKVEQPTQSATFGTLDNSVSVGGVVCKSHPPVDKQERDGLQSEESKQIKVEVKPIEIDVSDASGILVTQKLEKHVAENTTRDRDAPIESKCMNEMSAPKEESVKQSADVVNASKMEVSSLIELFTPEQVKEHIRGLRLWVGQSKTKAEKKKALGHSMSVNSCQLCAVEKLVFEPIPLYCSPCGVRIKRNALHYSVAAGESRHYVCGPCYNGVHENVISFGGNSIPKARLEKKKNDDQIEEGWVQCDKCLAWQHQICGLFNGRKNHGEETKYTCPSCYIQEVEQGAREPLPQSAIPGAKSLPVTALSNYIEQRLFKTLKKERQERARFQGKSYDEVPGAESLAVRVVASVDKVLEVKQHFLELFREENYPSEFPYKSKAILLFQKIESVEVCLFGMFVQEFGTDSGSPNQRRVYLSYLDSVKYFRPEVRTVSGEALRTFVYHEILIGYLDYCKKRGFTSCYIWACPPLKGEDYILYCHPEIQKTPKTDKLREWYLAMLRKASKEDVVVECTNLYDQFFVQSGECRANVTAARLPYFDGDYWPGAAEDLLHQMNQEGDGTKLNRKGSTKKVISKRALRAVGQLDLSVNASKDRLTMQKLGEIICPLKQDFIMVHLQHCCKHCCTLMVSGNRWVCKQCKNFQICDKCYEAEQKRLDEERHPVYQKEKHTLFPVAIKDVPIETEDKDNNIESEFFDTRQAFLSLCQGNNYQYDTLRRAKHSSMMLLYHLHNPTVPAFATTCTVCQQEIENAQSWYCRVCPGYDVCNACYSKASIDHPHNLISRSSATDTGVLQNGQANQKYQIWFEKMRVMCVHVLACHSKQCQYKGCLELKALFRHCIACKLGVKGCRNCKRFWFLIQLHARSCRDSKCTFPRCRDYRALISRQQQQSDKRRRAAVMEMMRERAAETKHTS